MIAENSALDRHAHQSRMTQILAELSATLLCFLLLASTLGPIVPAGTAALTMVLVGLGRHTAHRWRALLPFLLLPSFAVLSTLWSPSPSITAWYSVQLLLTFVAVLAMVAALPAKSFMRVMMWGALIAVIVSLALNTQGPSDRGPVLVGLGGSKNAMASIAYLLLIAGGTVLLDRGQAGVQRIVAVLSLPIAIYILSITFSSGVILVAVLAPVLAIGLVAIRAVPRRAKVPLFIGALLLVSPLLILSDDVVGSVEDYTLTLLAKDRTLTGRTMIWDAAKAQFQDHPVLGAGYRYFWMSLQPDAIGVLRSQNVVNPATFNFHNTYYELAADLGIIGALIGTLSIALAAVLCAAQALFRPGAFWIGATVFIIAMIIRSFGETLFQAFSLYGPLIFAFGGYALLTALSSTPIQAEQKTRLRWLRRYRRTRSASRATTAPTANNPRK